MFVCAYSEHVAIFDFFLYCKLFELVLDFNV